MIEFRFFSSNNKNQLGNKIMYYIIEVNFIIIGDYDKSNSCIDTTWYRTRIYVNIFADKAHIRVYNKNRKINIQIFIYNFLLSMLNNTEVIDTNYMLLININYIIILKKIQYLYM